MKHEIIYRNNYALIVSGEKIKVRDWFFNGEHVLQASRITDIIIDTEGQWSKIKTSKKVIAHRPLTDVSILEGVSLLPPFSRCQEDGAENAVMEFKQLYGSLGATDYELSAFSKGYNKAKETYKYTEKDLAEAYERGMNNIDSDGCLIDQQSDDFNDLIQSLQTKRPKYFKCETEVKCTGNNNNGCFLESPGHDCGCAWVYPTTSNLQGQKELKGEYIYG